MEKELRRGHLEGGYEGDQEGGDMRGTEKELRRG